MKLMKYFCQAIFLLLSISYMGMVQAYFVRPYIQIGGGGTIDGLEVNGATQRTEVFAGEAYSSVDLATGETKLSVDVTGTNKIAQAAGIFGDTVTFNVTNPTNVSFSFDYDGTIGVSNYNYSGSFLGTYVSAVLAVYEQGMADYTNFSSNAMLANALAKEKVFINFASGKTSDFTTMINDALSGSFIVPNTGNKSYDVFASLSLSVVTNLNPSTVVMDFLNTGKFGISGAAFNSANGSGVFLTQAPPSTVPVPSTAFLFVPALLGFLMAQRRRTTNNTIN